MRERQKFFYCKHCGNLVGLVSDKHVPMICCGEKLSELIPNTVEASAEKHIPEAKLAGDVLTVQVGSVAHPMEEEHNIAFIYVETEHGGQRKALPVGAAPSATFTFVDDKPIAVFAYCNLHGLWKVDL
ncbi:MAG: desulfoferrodoxin [Oscillospiraceae bacterium]|nr:desulfoferrodoxin [Oscillospiraceae bacterium]